MGRTWRLISRGLSDSLSGATVGRGEVVRWTRKVRSQSGVGIGFADGRDAVPIFAGSRRHPLLALTACVLLAALLSAVFTVSAWADEKAPKVTENPVSVMVEAGQSATFEAAAVGPPAPTVQWQISTNGGASWSGIAGATSDKLTIAETGTSESGDRFRAVFKNPKGDAISEVATLTVQIVPGVTEQPASTTVQEGQSASFEAAASGFPTPSVQWELSTNSGGTWSKIAKATSDIYTIASAKTSENGDEYRATFESTAGRATSEAATLTVELAPKVTTQPTSRTVEVGASATFEALAAGTPAPTVQWEESTDGGSTWSDVEGATSDQLTISGARRAESGDEYRARFENAAGHATSNAATLTVQDAPAVSEQPANTTVEPGQSATFETAATGIPTPTVQWELSTNEGSSWSAVEGAKSDQLTIASAALSESGDEYRAVFSSGAGTATSAPATLTVTTHHYSVVDWGSNVFGQLGNGDLENSDVPVAPGGPKFVTAVAASQHDTFALLSDGTVVAWGEDEYGQLGTFPGEEPFSDVPVPVQGLSKVVAIAAGNNFALALLRNGTVEAWGGNEYGQLGDGSLEEEESPVQVKGLTGVTAIAAGGETGLALLSDGAVKAWGANYSGEIGNGTFANTEAPVSVFRVSGATAIAAGGENSMALLGNGTVMAWGDDEYGQLANEEVEVEGSGERESDHAVPVEGVSGASAIAEGQRFGMALLAGGSVVAWGENKYGQLGHGSVSRDDETPTAVSDLDGAAQIAAGGWHAMALVGGGDVMTWGENKFGELGNGTVSAAGDTPVQAVGVGEQVGVAAGAEHDVAYGEPLPAVTGLSPDGGPVKGGSSVTITGIDLSEASAVSFGGVAASSFTVNSGVSITAIAPAHAVGAVDVRVTTPVGVTPVSPADEFTYAPPPSVKKLAPKSGSTTGGTVVTITGTGFSEASAVHFGTSAVTSFTIDSATTITAVTAAEAAGSVSVTVTSPFGTSAPSATKFKFKAPKKKK